jgi:predicted transcriptional regulator
MKEKGRPKPIHKEPLSEHLIGILCNAWSVKACQLVLGGFTYLDIEILGILAQEGKLTVGAIARLLNRTRRGTDRILWNTSRRGLIEPVGAVLTTYRLSDKGREIYNVYSTAYADMRAHLLNLEDERVMRLGK